MLFDDTTPLLIRYGSRIRQIVAAQCVAAQTEMREWSECACHGALFHIDINIDMQSALMAPRRSIRDTTLARARIHTIFAAYTYDQRDAATPRHVERSTETDIYRRRRRHDAATVALFSPCRLSSSLSPRRRYVSREDAIVQYANNDEHTFFWRDMLPRAACRFLRVRACDITARGAGVRGEAASAQCA